jgi:hypothetical protein
MLQFKNEHVSTVVWYDKIFDGSHQLKLQCISTSVLFINNALSISLK